MLNLIENDEEISSPTLNQLLEDKEFQKIIINGMMGLIAGLIVRKIIVGNSYNPGKLLMGLIIEFIVVSQVAQNAEEIKSLAHIIFNKLKDKLIDSSEDTIY